MVVLKAVANIKSYLHIYYSIGTVSGRKKISLWMWLPHPQSSGGGGLVYRILDIHVKLAKQFTHYPVTHSVRACFKSFDFEREKPPRYAQLD